MVPPLASQANELKTPWPPVSVTGQPSEGPVAAMVSGQQSCADWEGDVMESATVKQIFALPALDGVPERTPAELKVMPAGTPETTVQLCPVPEPPLIWSCTPPATPLYSLPALAKAGEKHCGCGGGTMVRGQHLFAACPKLSVRIKHICWLLVAVTVPVTVQVPAVSESPAGSEPFTAQLEGAVPPEAAKVPE